MNVIDKFAHLVIPNVDPRSSTVCCANKITVFLTCEAQVFVYKVNALVTGGKDITRIKRPCTAPSIVL
jgi:hypothetical protein